MLVLTVWYQNRTYKASANKPYSDYIIELGGFSWLNYPYIGFVTWLDNWGTGRRYRR